MTAPPALDPHARTPFAGRHEPDAQQKDNLCGPFWAARVLRDAGLVAWDGETVDEDLLAARAGTLLPDLPPDACVPPGAESRRDYRFGLETVPPGMSGTDPAALARALEEVSGGALTGVGVRGAWTAERVEALVEGALALDARLIANLRTGRLWGGRPRPAAVLAELVGHPVEGPRADWDVGHFCAVVALTRGRAGTLVLVGDSYPVLGWEGLLLQPPRAVAAALERGDGRQGGVIAVAPPAAREALEQLAAGIGLDIGFWDNGTRR